MNKHLYFIIGIVTGSVISGLVTFHITKKKYLDKADREIASVKKTFEEFYKRGTSSKEDSSTHNDAPKTTINVKKNGTKISDAPDHKQNTPIKDYRKYSNNYTSTTDCKLNENINATTDYIYEITQEEFAESEDNVLSVKYYPKDDILTYDVYDDKPNEPVEDRNYYINEKTLQKLQQDGRDYIYLHNKLLDLDIEITVVRDTYVGSASDPATKAIRRKAIKKANKEVDEDD